MICFPDCKINLGLYIEQKRDDGFHNIKTVFYPVQLNDALEFIVSDKNTEMDISGITIEGDIQSNLCMQAYNLLKEDYNLPPVKAHLHKAIPHGAGLGGGSSDAAFTIKLLNDLFSLDLSYQQMQQYASKLGSDCAFFIKNIAVIASEKGNVFKEIDLSLKGYTIIIVKPQIHVSTPDAYKWVKPRNTIIDIENIIKLPIENWKELLINDFEVSVFAKHPEIAAIKDKLYQNGAIYAAMSGSGASVFGLFKSTEKEIIFPDSYFVWKGIINQ